MYLCYKDNVVQRGKPYTGTTQSILYNHSKKNENETIQKHKLKKKDLLEHMFTAL